jgi:hypothetical protein
MISEKVYKLCTSKDSVSALLANNPGLSPEEAWKQIFGRDEAGENESISTAKANRDNLTPDDLRRAHECGNWGPTEPSELFLRVRKINFMKFAGTDTYSCTTMLSAHLIKASRDAWSVLH